MSVLKWQYACSRQLRLYKAFLSQLLTVFMPALIVLNCWNCGRTISYRERMCMMFMLHKIVLRASVYRKQRHFCKTGAMRENQLIPSHWFTEHLKQSCTWNSERLLLMPVDEKDKLRKTASSREDAVSVDACVENWVAPLSGHNRIWQS